MWQRGARRLPGSRRQPHLFHGTIADNLRVARPTASEADLIAAAQAAHAHDFIQRLRRL